MFSHFTKVFYQCKGAVKSFYLKKGAVNQKKVEKHCRRETIKCVLKMSIFIFNIPFNKFLFGMLGLAGYLHFPFLPFFLNEPELVTGIDVFDTIPFRIG